MESPFITLERILSRVFRHTRPSHLACVWFSRRSNGVRILSRRLSTGEKSLCRFPGENNNIQHRRLRFPCSIFISALVSHLDSAMKKFLGVPLSEWKQNSFRERSGKASAKQHERAEKGVLKGCRSGEAIESQLRNYSINMKSSLEKLNEELRGGIQLESNGVT